MFIAEEVRELMAQLGFRTVNEMVGQVGALDTTQAAEHWKAYKLDLTPVLHEPESAFMNQDLYCSSRQDHGLDKALDQQLIVMSREALDSGTPVRFSTTIANVNRTVGTMLGHEVTKAYGGQGLPDGTIDITFDGSAGNSFGAFVPKGITLRVYGDANDYVGKGLSGGRIVVAAVRRRARGLRRRGEHHRRQRDPVRRHQRPGLPARRGRRAVRGAQLRRTRGGRGRRRPRLRVHDRRQGRHPRTDRPQLRGGHVRRHRLRLRPRRRAAREPQRRDGRSRRRSTTTTSTGCTTWSSRTSTPRIRRWDNAFWPTGRIN